MIDDTILMGCEVLCLTGDLIDCPLSFDEQKVCKGRLQYQAGIREVLNELCKRDFYLIAQSLRHYYKEGALKNV